MEIEVDQDRPQTQFYLGKSATFEEFHRVYATLMCTTWRVKDRFGREEEINLTDRGWSFKYDNAKGRLGVCRGRKKEISMSRVLLNLNLDKDATNFEDTVRHEIAHAIDRILRGTSDHGPHWKRIARQVGAEPTRCSELKARPDFKWTLTCPSCGRKTHRHKLTARAKTMACGKCCKGTYQREFIFNKTQNF